MCKNFLKNSLKKYPGYFSFPAYSVFPVKIPARFRTAICTIKTSQSTSNIAYEWLPRWRRRRGGRDGRQIDLSPVEKPDAFNTRPLRPEIKTIKRFSRYLFDSINLSMAAGKSVPACQCATIFQCDIALGGFPLFYITSPHPGF